MALVVFQVELRRILEYEIMHFGAIAVDEMNQHRSSILIGEVFFIVVEKQDPPRVSSSVDPAASGNFDVSAVSER